MNVVQYGILPDDFVGDVSYDWKHADGVKVLYLTNKHVYKTQQWEVVLNFKYDSVSLYFDKVESALSAVKVLGFSI